MVDLCLSKAKGMVKNMKTLILYATKHGATADIARRIAQLIDDSVVHELNQEEIPSIDEFGCVIIGSPVYAGMIRKEAKSFLKHNADILCAKNLGLFLSAMDMSGEKKFFEENIPENILQSAITSSVLGAVFDPEKAGIFERLIMKLVTKRSGYVSTIDDEKIRQFAESIKTQSRKTQ